MTTEELEEYITCDWCGESVVKSDCKVDTKLGILCSYCARGLESRGEKLCLNEIQMKPEDTLFFEDGKEKIKVEKVAENMFLNTYNYEISPISAGFFKTEEEAIKMLMKHRPNAKQVNCNC